MKYTNYKLSELKEMAKNLKLIKSNWKSNIGKINDLIIVYSRAISDFL